MNSICKSQIGRYIQVLIDDGKTYTLMNEDYISGVKVTQAETDVLLRRDAVQKMVERHSSTVHFFMLQSDIDEFVKKVEYKLFRRQQYTEDSYIWVNEVLNMEGGDNYSIRRIHPNLVDTEGEYLSTSMQDSKGNYPYETELEGIRENGEVVHQYYFKNQSNDQIGEKRMFDVMGFGLVILPDSDSWLCICPLVTQEVLPCIFQYPALRHGILSCHSRLADDAIFLCF